ncbi:MAG: tetratricopeptide repeat protein [Acidobacteria bacterium]|nr:tetratricopeptide repeat protein [Acidobacteriota bacterium]
MLTCRGIAALILLLPALAFGAASEPPGMTVGIIQDSSIPQLMHNAQVSLERGDPASACATLEKVLSLDQKQKQARISLINLLMRQGRLSEAAEHAQTYGQLFPQEGEAYKLLAMTDYLLQHYDKFEKNIREAIRLNPQDADAHYHLGRYFFEEKRYKEARNAFDESLRIQPENYKAHYYAGLVYEGENDGGKAKQEYQTAIRIIDQQKVRYAWPFTDLGKWLINEGDYEKGVGWLYRATRNDPQSPHAWFHYAKALFQKEPNFEVKEALFVAIRLDAGYSDAYYLLARYYQKTGEAQLAKETFAKFDELKKNPVPSPFGLRRY